MLPNGHFCCYESSIARQINIVKLFDVTRYGTPMTQRKFICYNTILSVRQRHWQALIKRMNGQLIASV